MSNLQELKKQLDEYRNTLVINYYKFEVVKLLDVIDDDCDDYYWVMDDGKRIIHCSCVLDFIPLKGFIPDYERLVKLWNLNNNDPAI